MKQETPPEDQKSFLRRMGVIVAVLAMFAALIGTAVFVFQRIAPKSPGPVATSPSASSAANLPGLKGQISKRSKEQLQTIAEQNPHVVAVAALRYKYGKNETPYLYWWATPKAKAMVEKIIRTAEERQKSDKAMSSDEARAEARKNPEAAARELRNSEEARLGLVKCLPIAEAALNNPELKDIATGICYATIPPFDPNTAIAIIVLTDSDMTNYNEVAEMRRILLMLQIDIFNRDFQGRETWAHP